MEQAPSERVGRDAPVSVEKIDISDIKRLIANDSDNLRLVNIWATWCGPCVIEFPELITIDRMYRGRNFEFISLSADNPSRKNNVLRFLEKHEAQIRTIFTTTPINMP
jgi:thiol-disulfide isomerase/thioredoxin